HRCRRARGGGASTVSVIYLYAVAEALASAPEGPGLEDTPLELLEAGGLTAVHSAHASLELSPEPDALWRHERVVEEVMRLATVLPARFGTTFPDTESLAAALSGQGPRLLEQLERVRGCVELAVRVRLPEAEGRDSQDGGSYVQAKLAAHRQ